jgi:hypothetical protein
MNTALFVIATGEKYHKYIDPLLASARTHFVPHVPFLWTDAPELHNAFQFHLDNEGYPGTTLHRYHTFLKYKEIITGYDYVFYCDIDMLFVAPIAGEEIFADGITATLHPGYVGKTGTPERRLESFARIPNEANNKYFCGGFIGGKGESFLRMAEEIANNVDCDAKSGITAVWHDESHSNWYLYHNPPARILGPEYCYPEGCEGVYAGTQIGPPKLVALTKGPR